MSKKEKILILSRWFVPGVQAGGVIRAAENLVSNLSNEVSFFVLTTNTDFGSTKPYNNIETNTWLKKDDYFVMYLSKKHTNKKTIKKSILEVTPDRIYLNGFFDPLFNLYPLWMKQNKTIETGIILAPCGVLMESALKHKALKKSIFLSFFRKTKIKDQVTFHATSEEEKISIIENIGVTCDIQVMQAFPPKAVDEFVPILKEKNSISIVYISRIHPVKKNLAYLLEVLNKVNVNVLLNIGGPIEDEKYWLHCQDIIANLPTHITVNYLGKILNEEVAAVIQEHHLFAFPTTGENYGYVIIEALSASRPILISDQTPWHKLQEARAGWDFPLEKKGAFAIAIEEMAAMDQSTYDSYCKGALAYVKNVVNIEKMVEGYKEMFDLGVNES